MSSPTYREMAEEMWRIPMPVAVKTTIIFSEGDESSRVTYFGLGFNEAMARTGKPQGFSGEVAYSASKDATLIMRERALKRLHERADGA